MPDVGAKEPVVVESDGHFLNLLAFTSYILHHIGQVVRERLPRSLFLCLCTATKWLDSPPH